jgi:KDO2-lipid IV(A) lauroyltransferase
MHNPKMNKLLMDFRSGYGAKVVYSDEGLLKPLRILQRGEVFIILIDQDIPKGKGTFVDFFGKPAYTPIGAAWLALKSNAAVVPLAIHRLPNERHLVTILPEVEVSRSGNNEQDIQENTQRFTNALEHLIRQEPSQWVWMHKRWKTQPLTKAEPVAS